MKKLLSVLLHPITLGVLGLLLVSALIWWAGPLIGLGDSRPLASETVRWVVLAVVWLLGAARIVWSILRRRRANAALLKGMAAGPSASAKEESALQERFSQALQLLRKAPGSQRRWWQGSASLYDMPWYMFVGAPGSGKTTALLNAGLNFPLAEKLGQASLRGVGGTRNCEWWFTDAAVLIDTAGRYATQDSDKDTDAAAWHTFLDLLRKARPRRPINGVLLTVSTQDLLGTTPDQRKEHAARLRGRMQELQTRLGVRAPVYVLVTKCDLLAGFDETFGAMGKADRDQVFGFTFAPAAGKDPMVEFASEYGALEKRLRDRLIERMEAQTDVLRRTAVFAFPQQFSGLKGLLGGFLEGVFSGSGQLDERPVLRGVYFTSGTQEGTPIDRVLGTLARTFGVERRLSAPNPAKGKSYFLHRLLCDVVFAEQDLVGSNAAVEKRNRILRKTGLAALMLGSVALLAGWTMSYFGNQKYIAEIKAKTPALRATVDALPASATGDVTALPEPLAAVRDAAQPAGMSLTSPPLSVAMGLFQGDKLDAGAQIAYQHLLEHTLSPAIVRRMEERLRTASRTNLEFAYEALKAYVMLYNPEHQDPEALKAWITVDWDANLEPSMGADRLSVLKSHLDALVARGIDPGVPMDKALVANVRDMLVAFPLEYRIFSRLKRLPLATDLPEFSVAAAAGPQSASVFVRASGEPLTRGIPGKFTREGYHQVMQASVDKLARQLADEETWVLGTTTPRNASVSNKLTGDRELADRVRRLYLEEYTKVWDAYMADVKLVKITGLDRGIAVARLLSAVDSPLASFLRAAARETTLVEPNADPRSTAGAAAALAEAKAQAAVSRSSDLAALVGTQPRPASTVRSGPVEQFVDDHFAALHRLVTGQPAPLDDILKLFNDVYVQLSAVDDALKSKSPPPAGGGGQGKLKAAAGQQPEPVRTILESLASATDSQNRAVERQSLTGELQPITDFCSRAVAGRYPIAQGSLSDVLPEDFGQFFAPGGMMDDFFQRKLVSLVDIGSTPWSFRPTSDGGRPVAPAALADFQRAARIREVFFRGGGKTPAFRVDIRALELADGIKELSLDVDGQVSRFAAGSSQAVSLQWPGARLSSQIKLQTNPGSAPLVFEGPWALFRLFDRFEVQATPQQPERFVVVMNLDGRRARLEVTASSVFNPFRMRELQQFRCPGAL